jgi:hypothetical protein
MQMISAVRLEAASAAVTVLSSRGEAAAVIGTVTTGIEGVSR